MKRNSFLIIVVAIIVLGLSCKDNEVSNAASSNPNVVIPLSIGNQWVTHTASWDSAGWANVMLIDTARIVRDSSIQFEQWFIWRNGVCATNRSTGYWVMSNLTPGLLFKYPASLNEKYIYNNDTVKVIAMDTTITVSSGTFSCICYNITYSIPDFVNQVVFVSLKKGIIRRDIFARTLSGREYLASHQELYSFQIK